MNPNRKMMSLSVLILATLLAMGRISALSADADGRKIEMKKLLPMKIGDYHSDGKDEFYDRSTAFRYMDGAAELYRSYGFKLLMVRRFIKTDHPPLIVEFFDMGSSEDAFGVFSYETGDEEVSIGQGSDFGGGLLRFWKGKFFVNVYAEQEAPLAKQDILDLGRTLADSIKRQGKKPKLINLLPREDLIERSIRYFHHHQSLNYHYFVSHQNILRLGERTNALFSTYLSQTEGKTFLLLIQYPSQTLAKGGLHSFVKSYMPESSSLKVTQTENRRWTAVQCYKNYVMVVLDAPSKEKTEALIQATQRNLERESS